MSVDETSSLTNDNFLHANYQQETQQPASASTSSPSITTVASSYQAKYSLLSQNHESDQSKQDEETILINLEEFHSQYEDTPPTQKDYGGFDLEEVDIEHETEDFTNDYQYLNRKKLDSNN